MDKEEFIKKTKDVLEITDDNSNRIAPRGFEINDTDMKSEHCILIVGLNPAGNEKDAEREKLNLGRTYFFSTEPDDKIITDWIYNKYFRPIFDFTAKTVNDVKWPWCNQEWSVLEKEINQYDDLKKYREKFENHYMMHKDNTHTIYIGDMFYYHETSSKKIPFRKGVNFGTYCKEMLELHIETLKSHNKTIDYIYINNAQVSHWLCNGELKTFDELDGVKVFYGAMLSGQRCLDIFSRERLINEIKEKLKK